MGVGRDISAQICKTECDKSHKRNQNKMLKLFKKGMTASSLWGKEMREETEPSRKITHKKT